MKRPDAQNHNINKKITNAKKTHKASSKGYIYKHVSNANTNLDYGTRTKHQLVLKPSSQKEIHQNKNLIIRD